MFAAVQSLSVKGYVPENVRRYVLLVEQAIRHGAQFALFPELSLTGYESSIARDAFVTQDDLRLRDLCMQARELGVTVVAGAPYPGENGELHIAALSFLPDGGVSIYRKQHLHPGEDEFFEPGDGGELLDIHGEKVAPAGRSAVWDADGELVAAAAENGECIVLAGMENGRWHGAVIGGALRHS